MPQDPMPQPAASPALLFSVPEEITAEADGKGGEKPREKEDADEEAAPTILFTAAPAAAAPPPDPLPLALALPVRPSGDTAEPEGRAVEQNSAFPEMPAGTAGIPARQAAPEREPAAAVAAAPFAVPSDPGPRKGGNLTFAARIQVRQETLARPSEPEPAPLEPQARAGVPTPEFRKVSSNPEAVAPRTVQPEPPAAAIADAAPAANTPPEIDAGEAVPQPAIPTAVRGQSGERNERAAQPVMRFTQAAERVDSAFSGAPERRDAEPAETVDNSGPAPVSRAAGNAKPEDGREKREERGETRTVVETAGAKRAPATAPEAAVPQQAPPAQPVAENRVVREHAAAPTHTAAVAALEQPETHRAGAAHEITLKLSPTRESGVEVRVVERAGEVRVAVRTPDGELAQSLRQNLGDLTRSLEDRGYRSETWHPAAAQAASSGSAPQDNRSDGGNYGDPRQAWSGGEGQHGGEGRRRHPQQPAWVEELEQQTGDEPASSFRSFLR
jgi:hypothetical protein